MKKLIFTFLLMISVIVFGCAVQRQSQFSSNAIKGGMTKEAILAKYGRPYKESSSIDSNHTLYENLHYKEQVYLGRWYEVNSILHLENSIFKSIEQGKEQLLYKDAKVIVK